MEDTPPTRRPALTRRRFLTLSIAAGAGVILSGCGGDNDDGIAADGQPRVAAQANTARERVKAKLGMVTGINSSDVYLANSLGFFDAHGVDAELITFANPTLMRDALISGEIDLSAQAPLHVYLSQAQGTPLKIIANRRNIVDVALVVRSGLTDVRDVAALKGRTIATSAVGSWDWAIICGYLRAHGLDAATDVQFVNRGATSAYSLLRSGQVDAAAANPPDLTQVIQEEIGTYLVDPAQPETHERYFGSTRAMSRAWLSHQRVIDERPEVIAGVVKAANDTYAYIHATPVADVVQALLPQFEGTSAETLEAAISNDLAVAIPSSAVLSRAAYDADQQIFVNAGLLDETIPFEAGVDGTWAGVEE